jgi:carotenoid cleavage dioxygenase-like enzyme
MQRRKLLRQLLASATTLILPPALLRGAAASAGDAAQFAAGLREHSWLAGWKSVTTESLGPGTAELHGRLPTGLVGTLYRNGPAWMERAGFRYEHWFDGDGMVHGWKLGAGGIRHHSRMVATPKFTREQQAGRFRYPVAGTTIADALPVRNNDDVNVANTSVTQIAGRLFALCEAGSAFELDPDQLTTLGPVTWRRDLAALPFSAHPLRDHDGSVWNFGSLALLGGGGLIIWHIGADGRLLDAQMLDTPVKGYLHAFVMTRRYLVFVLMPFHFADGEGAFFERLRFEPAQGCRIAVVPKDAPAQVRWFEAEFAAIYHFGDAIERRGRIVLRAVRHADSAAMLAPRRAAMAGQPSPRRPEARLADLHLDLDSGRAHWQPHATPDLEFPQFDARTPDDRPARLYAPTVADPVTAPYFNAVVALDLERGRQQLWRYGADILAEEHVFVPRPGSSAPDDGWLVGTLLDAVHGRSGLAVLDARHVDEGPLALGWLPYSVPLGFHGHFAAHPAPT